MARTPQQIAADDALTEAIKQVERAYADGGEDPDRYLLTDYVIVTAANRFDAAEGASYSRVSILMRDSDVPAYKVIGLLRFALERCNIWVGRDED